MLAPASSSRPSRSVHPVFGHMQGPAILALLTGFLCWGTYFVRSTVRLTAAPHMTQDSNQAHPQYITAFAFGLAESNDEVKENNDGTSSDIEMPIADINHVITDLTVQSVLMSPTRRIAMICDHLVSEGQFLSRHGHSFKVTAIRESGVDLEIAATQVHLPLESNLELESEVPRE